MPFQKGHAPFNRKVADEMDIVKVGETVEGQEVFDVQPSPPLSLEPVSPDPTERDEFLSLVAQIRFSKIEGVRETIIDQNRELILKGLREGWATL